MCAVWWCWGSAFVPNLETPWSHPFLSGPCLVFRAAVCAVLPCSAGKVVWKASCTCNAEHTTDKQRDLSLWSILRERIVLDAERSNWIKLGERWRTEIKGRIFGLLNFGWGEIAVSKTVVHPLLWIFSFLLKAHNYITAQNSSHWTTSSQKQGRNFGPFLIYVLIAVNHNNCELLGLVLQGPMLFISAVCVTRLKYKFSTNLSVERCWSLCCCVIKSHGSAPKTVFVKVFECLFAVNLYVRSIY